MTEDENRLNGEDLTPPEEQEEQFYSAPYVYAVPRQEKKKSVKITTAG